MKKRMTIDRFLLVLILIFQIGILASFHIKKKEQTGQQKLLPTILEEQSNVIAHPADPDPLGYAGFEEMNQHMNRMIEQAMNEFEYMQKLIDVDSIWHAMPATPAMDMRETEDSYTIAFSMPGISPTDIIVTLDGRELTIFSPSHDSELNTRILLPGPVKESDYAKSVFTNGILTVNVPKHKENEENITETIGL